ncbi:unnamed protein product, partial [Mesorhabditis spiculigera]
MFSSLNPSWTPPASAWGEMNTWRRPAYQAQWSMPPSSTRNYDYTGSWGLQEIVYQVEYQTPHYRQASGNVFHLNRAVTPIVNEEKQPRAKKAKKRRRRKPAKMNFNGRGGYNGYGGRGRGSFPRKQFFRKRDNQQDDIPYSAVPEGEPFSTFPIKFDNIVCFHGFQSIFTTQHMFPVLIDGRIYESCDHYYQIEKTQQLCGKTSDKMTATVRDSTGKRLDGQTGFRSHEEKGYSALAKDMIREQGITKEVVEDWRRTKGLAAIQKALSAKVSQCEQMRTALRNTGDKILVHAYAGDAIYGAGTRLPGIKAWCDEQQKTQNVLTLPMRFPLDNETVQQCPATGKGRNVLGVILMQLRYLLIRSQIEEVDLSSVFDGLAVPTGASAVDTKEILDDPMEGFNIGGGTIQQPILA